MEANPTPDEQHLVALLEQCESKIAKLEARLKRQRGIQKTLKTNLLILPSRTAPISRVPQEILLMIFEEVKRDLEDPLAIGSIIRVCRKWNTIATNSPSLWATISLTIKPDVSAIECYGNYVKTAISHSKTSPLNITLSLPSMGDLILEMLDKLSLPEDTDDSDHVYFDLYKCLDRNFVLYENADRAILKFMRIIAGSKGKNIRRLRSLEIYFCRGDFPSWFDDKPFQHPTPLLEELVFAPDGVDSDPIPPALFVHPAPNLSRIAYDPRYQLEDILSSNGNVTDLRLFHAEWDYLREILTHQLLRNLKTFAFRPPFLLPAAENEHEIMFPVLGDLTLFGRGPLGFIRAPRLITLRLLGDQDYSSNFYRNFCFSSLRKLHMDIYPNVTGSIKNYVDKLSTLTEVGLLNRNERVLKDCVREMKSALADRNIAVKGYACSPTTSNLGFSPYRYENKEIQIGH